MTTYVLLVRTLRTYISEGVFTPWAGPKVAATTDLTSRIRINQGARASLDQIVVQDLRVLFEGVDRHWQDTDILRYTGSAGPLTDRALERS